MSDDRTCNLCGLSCRLTGEGADLDGQLGGLIDACASGGFDSTPGNGCGALDDMTSYEFSLCEFCLDWLFSQFVVPVAVFDRASGDGERWVSAEERVRKDAWRRMKGRFFDRKAERDAARRVGALAGPAGLAAPSSKRTNGKTRRLKDRPKHNARVRAARKP